MNMYGMYGDHQYPGFAFGNLGMFAQRMAEFDDLTALPEEIQEEINQHEDEFLSLIHILLDHHHEHYNQPCKRGHHGLLLSPRSDQKLVQYSDNNTDRGNLKN